MERRSSASQHVTPVRGAFAGETFASERQYRNALARRKGFASWYAQQRAEKKVTPKTFEALSQSEARSREAALEALRALREGKSLSAATREAHTTANTVMRWVKPALARDAQGRWHAKTSDRLFRRMVIVTGEGLSEIDVRTSRQASQLARYMNAVRQFLATGDERVLDPYRGQSVAGATLETDPDVLEAVGLRHTVSFESIYSTVR